jgi:hypothetical protein
MCPVRDLRVLHDEPRFGLVGCGNLRAAIWRDAPTLPQVQALRDASLAYAERWPQGTGFVNLIVSGTPRFTDDVRSELAALGRNRKLRTLATAHIVAVAGFRGTATRAFLGTLFILARAKIPIKVFASAADAGPWMAPLLGPDGSPADVEHVCNELVERLGLEPGEADS